MGLTKAQRNRPITLKNTTPANKNDEGKEETLVLVVKRGSFGLVQEYLAELAIEKAKPDGLGEHELRVKYFCPLVLSQEGFDDWPEDSKPIGEQAAAYFGDDEDTLQGFWELYTREVMPRELLAKFQGNR